MKICDWNNLDTQIAQLVYKIEHSEKVSGPFIVLATTNSPELQRKAAEIYTLARFPLNNTLPKIAKRQRHKKIRLGYFSADFTNHPGAYSMVECLSDIIALNLKLFGFSFSPKGEYELKSRIESLSTNL